MTANNGEYIIYYHSSQGIQGDFIYAVILTKRDIKNEKYIHQVNIPMRYDSGDYFSSPE